MRGYVRILWSLFLILILMVCMCLARKRRGKTHDKTFKSRVKNENEKARASKYMNDVMHEICLPSESDRLVYRYKNDSHIFIGFDDIQKDTIYSMSWKIGKGALTSNNQNEFQMIPASQVRKYVTTEHLLAAANQKLQDKFRDNIFMCSQSKITSQTCIIQSFARLARKMEEVAFGKYCGK